MQLIYLIPRSELGATFACVCATPTPLLFTIFLLLPLYKLNLLETILILVDPSPDFYSLYFVTSV